MEKERNIWVFGDHRNHPKDRLTLQVIAQARGLCGDSGSVTVLLLGNHVEEFAGEYIAHGAHRVLVADHPGLAHYQTDLFTAIITDLIREEKPDALLLGASDFGRELAARVAKRIGTGLGADCVSFEWDREKQGLVGFSPAFGGTFLARICWNTARPHMATVGHGTCLELPHDESARGEIVKVERDPDHIPSGIKIASSVREPHPTSRLEDAKIVVVGGRGVRNLQGFNLVRELALLMGGEVGATRPAVDAHWTSHDQLIGQTGKSVKPALLISCGTSGAIQYTAAIGGSGTVVAMNRDIRAPIFKMADFGVVTDALSFPRPAGEMKERLFSEITDLYRAQVSAGRSRRSVSFGQRIKKLREDHKMSVGDLAERTGQPPEFIERVESNSMTPPVSFLLQLSHALQIDPSKFLTDKEKVQIDGKRQEGFAKRTQNYSYRTLTPGAADKHLRSFMVLIEPRERHKMVEYKHPGEEFIYVLKGELEVTLGTKVSHLKQGETIHFDSETKHKLRNISDERCELIVTLYTP